MKTLLKNKTSQHAFQTLVQQKYEKIKVSTIAATLTAMICSATAPSYASDIEIYTKPNSTVGSGVVVMMLDTSGSMSIDQGGKMHVIYRKVYLVIDAYFMMMIMHLVDIVGIIVILQGIK